MEEAAFLGTRVTAFLSRRYMVLKPKLHSQKILKLEGEDIDGLL